MLGKFFFWDSILSASWKPPLYGYIRFLQGASVTMPSSRKLIKSFAICQQYMVHCILLSSLNFPTLFLYIVLRKILNPAKDKYSENKNLGLLQISQQNE